MDKLIDYTKYTLALSVALFLYIPANFLPVEEPCLFWVLVSLMGALLLSTVFGILLYTRATKVLIEDKDANSDEKRWTNLWGRLHLGLLILSFLAVSPFFFYKKVWAPSTKVECAVTFDTQDGKNVTLKFPCQS